MEPTQTKPQRICLGGFHLLGFKTCLISNNDEERVKRFNKNIGTIMYIRQESLTPKDI